MKIGMTLPGLALLLAGQAALAATVPQVDSKGSWRLPALSVQVTVDGKPSLAPIFAEATFGATFAGGFYGEVSESRRSVRLEVSYDQAGNRALIAPADISLKRENLDGYGFMGIRLVVNPRGKSTPGSENRNKRATTVEILLAAGGQIPDTVALEGNENLAGPASLAISRSVDGEGKILEVGVNSFARVAVRRWWSNPRGYEGVGATIESSDWECLDRLGAQHGHVSLFGRMDNGGRGFIVEDVDDATLALCEKGPAPTQKQSRVQGGRMLESVRVGSIAWDGK